jgi:hypothetical protein
MAVLVGAIVMAAMLSAIVVDRWLARHVVPVVITMAPSDGTNVDASHLKKVLP